MIDPIVTPRLTLRSFAESDLPDYHDLFARPDVVRYLYLEPLDRDGALSLLRRRMAQGDLDSDGGLVLAIELREPSPRVIGEIMLWIKDRKNRQAEIGFVLHPEYQRRGFAREAASAVLDHAFGPANLHRVYGRTDGRNDASAGLMRSLGMRQEAHFRENEIFKGAWGDELIFAILEGEWRAP